MKPLLSKSNCTAWNKSKTTLKSNHAKSTSPGRCNWFGNHQDSDFLRANEVEEELCSRMEHLPAASLIQAICQEKQNDPPNFFCPKLCHTIGILELDKAHRFIFPKPIVDVHHTISYQHTVPSPSSLTTYQSQNNPLPTTRNVMNKKSN